MKIGFFADQYLPVTDGIISSMVNARQGLSELGHEVVFVIPEYKGRGKHKNEVLIKALPVPTHKNIRMMRPEKNDIDKIKSLGIDVIHSHTQFAAGRLAHRMSDELDVPHVTTIHTLFPEWISHYPLLSYLILGPIKYYLNEPTRGQNKGSYNVDDLVPSGSKHRNIMATAWRHTGAYCDAADSVITPSRYVADKLRSLGVKQDIHAVPNGILLDKFSRGKPSKDKPLKLVFVGRLSREKRQSEVLKALKTLPNGIVELTLIGDGPAKVELKLQAQRQRLSNVEFAGAISPQELRKRLARFDAGVLASYGFETQGMVLVEYMASGLPVIYCDPNLKEVVGSKAGLMTGPDAASLAKGIKDMAAGFGQRKTMSQAALKQSEQYSYLEVAKQMAGIYEGLVKSG